MSDIDRSNRTDDATVHWSCDRFSRGARGKVDAGRCAARVSLSLFDIGSAHSVAGM